MARFIVLWLGQMVSLIGSGLTTFALGLWVYQHTGSIAKFAFIAGFAVLPNVLIAPIAGALVDRWNRRTIMIYSDGVSAISVLLLCFLFFTHRLSLWHIYPLVVLNSMGTVFRLPSYMALLSQLVPPEQIGRATGMMQMGPASAQLFSPFIAAILIANTGYTGVVLADLLTFAFSVLTLVIIKVPDLASKPPARRSLLSEAAQGWRYIMDQPELKILLLLFIMLNITFSFYQALITPVILGFTNSSALGFILSTGGIGLVLGSLLLSVWGGPKKRINGLLGFGFLYSIGLLVSGLRPSTVLVTVAVFLTLFSVPFINGCNQMIWQSKTAMHVQGRVFAIRTMIGWSSSPVAFFLAGPLADRFFEPALAIHGRLAGSWLNVIGVGKGRGAALLLVLSGLLSLIVTMVSWFSQALQSIEESIPYRTASASGG